MAFEKEIRGRTAEERLAVRQKWTVWLINKRHAWFGATASRMMTESSMSDAMKYALRSWAGFTRFLSRW